MNLILGQIFLMDQISGIKSKTPGYMTTHIFYEASSLTWLNTFTSLSYYV